LSTEHTDATRLEIGLVVAVLLLSLWLRVERIDLMQFSGDQAQFLHLAASAAAEGRLPAVGLRSSATVHLPGVFVWLLIPLATISTHPIWITVAIALLNVAGIAALYLLARRCAGPAVALCAAALLGCGLYPLHYSRSIWNFNVIPPLTCLAALGLWEALRGGRGVWLPVSAALVAALVQIHPTAAGFALAWGVAWLFGMRRGLVAASAAGVVVAALVAAPFLVHEARHDWVDLKPVPGPGHASRQGGEAVAYALSELTTRDYARYFLGDDAARFEAGTGSSAVVAGWILIAALLAGLGIHARNAWRRWRTTRDRAALGWDLLWPGWLLFTPLLLELSPLRGYPHYLSCTLPAQAYFAALGLLGWSLPVARGRALQIAVATVVCVIHVAWFAAFIRFIDANPHRATGDFTRLWRDVVPRNPRG